MSETLDPDELIPLGRFGRAHGRHGEVRLWAYNMQSETLRAGLRGWARFEDDSLEALEVNRMRWGDRFAIIGFSSTRFRDQAEALCHAEFVVTRDVLPQADEDEIYLVDLMGLPVWTVPEGEGAWRCVGVVWRFMETGANDVMVVRLGNEKNLLVPIVDHALVALNPDLGCVILAPMEEWGPRVDLPTLSDDDIAHLFDGVLTRDDILATHPDVLLAHAEES